MWMPQYHNNEKSTLIQLVSWGCHATSHYLNKCWPRCITPCGITWWLNMSVSCTGVSDYNTPSLFFIAINCFSFFIIYQFIVLYVLQALGGAWSSQPPFVLCTITSSSPGCYTILACLSARSYPGQTAITYGTQITVWTEETLNQIRPASTATCLSHQRRNFGSNSHLCF